MKPRFASNARSVLLFTAAVTVVFLASGQAFPQDTGPAPADGNKHTLKYSSPKVALRDLRFVFSEKGRLFVEFMHSQWMVADALIEAHPEFSYDDHERMADVLPVEAQRFVFQHIPETLGDEYNVFFPKSFEWQRRALSGVALHPFWQGFMGVLSGAAPEGSRCREDYGFAPLIVGLAFRSAKEALARQMPHDAISEARKSRIAGFITKKLAGGDPEFLPWVDISVARPKFIKWIEIFIGYPNVKAVLTVVEVNNAPNTAGGETAQYLFCILERKGGPVIVPFDQGAEQAVIGGALLYEDEETDTSPRDSELFILPDLDGNGGEELLVVSTVSALFTIVSTEDTFREVDERKVKYFVKEVQSAYFGP